MADTITVHAPRSGWSGEVAGVTFSAGTAEVPPRHPSLNYFRRHGYGIDEPVDPPELADLPDDPPVQVQGTELRDAAVDPRPDDFLPPTNAGEAHPHSQLVVSPTIHGHEGVKTIPGGDVHVDDPDAQEAKETAAVDSVDVELPPGNASRDEWAEAADRLGVKYSDDDGRNDIRDAVQAAH